MKDNYLEQFEHVIDPVMYGILQFKRNEIFRLVNNIFWKINKVELTLTSITVIAEDQSGYPFQALYMVYGTGHSTEKFYNMVISVLQQMQK